MCLDEVLSGVAGLTNVRDHDSAEIFYWIAHPFRGKGMSKYALEHLEQKATTLFSLSTLYAYVDQENKLSAQVLDSDGYEMVLNAKGTFFDQELYQKRIDKQRNNLSKDTYILNDKPAKTKSPSVRL